MKLGPISSLLRAISQPVRLEILLAIGSGEACVCHLEAITGHRQAYISQQLMALRGAGIVTSRRDGRNIYYQLEDPEVLHLIHKAAEISGIKDVQISLTGPANFHADCPCPKCELKLENVIQKSTLQESG